MLIQGLGLLWNMDQFRIHGWKSVWIILCLMLLARGGVAQSPGCRGQDPCRCVLDDGSGVIDVSSLGNFSGQARFNDGLAYDGTPFLYNPCFSVYLEDCRGAAVCKKVNGKFTNQGGQDSARWFFRGRYPIITYTSSNKKTEVMLLCDQNFTSPQLTVIGDMPSGVAAMMLWTQCACPGACKRVDAPGESSMSDGSIALIVFFSLLMFYLVSGALLNCAREGKSGKQILPNYDSWSQAPGLILDGFRLTGKAVCCSSREKKNYDSIQG